MLKVKHAVIALGHDDYRLRRFEDPRLEIKAGRLPKRFQAELYGPSKWYVSEVLPEEVSKILEAVALLVGTERSNEFARTIFEAGKRAGVQEGVTLCSKKPKKISRRTKRG